MPSPSPATLPDAGDGLRTEIGFAQSLLPPGLQLIHQLAWPAQCGVAFKAEDRRLVGAPAIVRRIQFLDIRSTDTWRDHWFSRLRALSTIPFHHVYRPLEFGTAGTDHVYLVFDWLPATLAEQIPATGLSDPQIVQSLLGQLVAGLEELHAHLGVHGAFRADLVYVDTNSLSEESRLWIGGVELGHLAFWTDGSRQLPATRDYFPPEWQGKLLEPSQSADVFALGLLAIELVAGRDARTTLAAKPSAVLNRAREILKQRRPWWNPHRFILQLLNPLTRRPADGALVKKWLDRWRWRASVIVPSSVIAAAFVLTVSAFYSWSSSLRIDIDAAELRASAAEKSAREETDRNSRLETENGEIRGELAEARTRQAVFQKERDVALAKLLEAPSTPRPDNIRSVWSKNLASERKTAGRLAILDSLKSHRDHSQLVLWSADITQAWDGISRSFTKEQFSQDATPTDREAAYHEFRKEPWNETRRLDFVKATWHDFAGAKKTTEDKLAAIEGMLVKMPAKNWLREELSRHLKLLRARQAAWVRWEAQPTKLTEAWRDRIDAPWEAQLKSSEERQLTALDLAEQIWRDVDARGELTWSQFQEQLKTAVAATGNPLVERTANVWIDEFNRAASVTFQPVQGTSPKRSGLFRIVDVHIDGSYSALDNEVGHTWLVETTHNYPATTTPIRTPWHLGQTIQIKIYGERQSLRVGARPAYIDQKFTGPIAIWRLAQQGAVSTGGHSLTLRVLDCPGPPPPTAEISKTGRLLK